MTNSSVMYVHMELITPEIAEKIVRKNMAVLLKKTRGIEKTLGSILNSSE